MPWSKNKDEAIRIANSKFSEGGVFMNEKKLHKGALRFDAGGSAVLQFEEVEVEGAKTQKPKLKMVGYSGGVIKDHWYWGNLGIDLSGMKFSKDRYPLLQDHRTDVRLAHMGKPQVVNNQLSAPEDDVVFLENDNTKQFLAESSKGFPFQASIYARPLKVVRLDEDQEHPCNGFTVKGPGAVWLESEFKEMSVCVFGADSNTSAAAFTDSEYEICTFAEVNLSGSVPDDKTIKKEVKRMDKEQLKKDHPDLYNEIVAEGKAQFVAQPDPEVAVLKEENKSLKVAVANLSKENELRREKEIKMEANSVWAVKLNESELPERLHAKIQNMVDYNKFVKDQALDTAAFSVAIDAEIKSWVDLGVKGVVLGEGTVVKTTSATSDKEAENQKMTARLLDRAGQKKSEK